MRVPRRKPKAVEFGDLFLPEEASEPILARPIRAALLQWLVEIGAEADLKAVGVAPRKRAIFDGPPGVGKTTLAHHLAGRLGLPMLAVRPDLILSKYVNESTENVGRLFEAVKAGVELDEGGDPVPVVLLLDEFDALARQRRSATQAADDGRNEMVNALLQRIEQYEGFLIAATNYGASVDQAVWRRFDIHITLELPGQEERVRILERYLAPYGLPEDALAELGQAFETASPALMRSLCEDLKRQLVVGPRLDLDMGKGPVFERLLASRHPHPDAGKPRLWSHMSGDRAVHVMPWPLPMAVDVARAVPEVAPAAKGSATVTRLRRPS